MAGGSGTRLYPTTLGVVKQLLPVYDKPMIYYPLSVLMLAGIREILIISTPKDIDRFKEILNDGRHLGINIEYKTQKYPNGIAEAFIIGEEFLNGDNVCLILGDNLIYGEGLIKLLEDSKVIVELENKAVIFGYFVDNPSAYGVIEFDTEGKVVNIEEKPQYPKSNYAVIGLYFFPRDVVNIAKTIKPSDRGELEITSINQYYLSQKRLHVEILGRGYAWLDMGNPDSLLDASNFISIVEKRQGLKIACIEEVAYRKGFIDKVQLLNIAHKLKNTQYGMYLFKILNT